VELTLNIFRGILIVLTQLTIIYYIAGAHDLLFGFNQTDAGFGTLLLLFFLVPVLNLVWLGIEISLAIKLFRQTRTATFLMPAVALALLVESLAIDLYLLSQVRM
jgi:hypothetical protein